MVFTDSTRKVKERSSQKDVSGCSRYRNESKMVPRYRIEKRGSSSLAAPILVLFATWKKDLSHLKKVWA